MNHTLKALHAVGDEFEVASWGRVGRFLDFEGGVWRDRILACSRACAGLEDPEVAVRKARESLTSVIEWHASSITTLGSPATVNSQTALMLAASAARTALLKLGENVSPEPNVRPDPYAALSACLGAMDAMRTQIEQMRGMFKDSDGRIAQACADHFEAAQLAGAALKAHIQEG